MCGILGFVTAKPSEENAKYFKRILRLSMARGSEATGIAYAHNDKLIVDKAPINSQEFIKTILPKHEAHLVKARWAIGHTRAPTIGSPKNNVNNHPVDSPDWILIHNGTVTNMDKIKGYKYKGEVDTELLVSYIQEYGIEKGLPYVGRGSAAIVAVNKKDLNTLYLWREVNPIKMAYDDTSKTVFWASEDNFLEKGLANKMLLFTSFQLRELPVNLLIKITVDSFKIDPIDYITVHKTVYTYGNTYYGGDTSGMNWRNNKLVWSNKSHRWLEKEELEAEGKEGSDDKEADKKADEKKEGADRKVDDDSKDNTMVNSLLKDMGYSIDEIARMRDGTKATIIYRGVKAKDVNITIDGRVVNKDKPDEPIKPKLSTRYYFDGVTSKDFRGWIKLTPPNRGYLSADGALLKKWDKDRSQHFLISWEDAVKEQLADELALEKDYALNIGYDKGEDKNNLTIEEQK